MRQLDSKQGTKKLDEIRTDLNSQILAAENSAITEQVLPSIRNTLGEQGKVKHTVADIGPVGYTGAPKLEVLGKYRITARRHILNSVTEVVWLGRLQ